MLRLLPKALPLVLTLTLTAPALANQADLTLAKAFQAAGNRCTSRIMVRVIPRTDRAALDYAAYDRNPLFHYPMDDPPRTPESVPSPTQLDFGGALVSETICKQIADTPLTEGEKARPLAWRRLMKYLSEWDWDLALPLLEAGTQVSDEKWGNDDLVRPLQQIATAYLHGDEIWVKVEFRPEVTWLPIDDEDGDRYGEVYARIDPGATAGKALAQIRGDYLATKLSGEEIETYFFELASDWYQALKTEALEPEETRPWPTADTEPDIAELMDGKSFAEPLIVMRGKPYGVVIYNVFLPADAVDAAARPAASRVAQAGRVALEADRYQAEAQQWGGSYEAWSALLKDFGDDVRAQLEARPDDLAGLIGKDDFLFFRGDLNYLLSGDLREQPEGKDPYPAIVDTHQQLAGRGIDLLMVLIPTKAEVFPERISDSAPEGATPYVAPYGRKLAGDLANAGVESVDLLPTFIEQRDIDGDLLYMPQDTHWTPRGMKLAAKLIADRVRQYPWYPMLRPGQVEYSEKEAPFTRLGDICDMLTDREKLAYRPLELVGRQIVAPDGSLYEDDPESPIVMLGDSFTGVFHFEDCEHAGLSAHVAKELGQPIDLIMAQGSGPKIRGRLARRGADAINSKKLVIWTVVNRDLYNYWSSWDIIKLP